MARRRRRTRAIAGPFNWLEDLDKKAETLPRASSWLGSYWLFMLARYSRLRPTSIPGNAHSSIMCEAGERSAADEFEAWESRIAGSSDAVVCLKGLDTEQRKQLAALMIDIVSDLDMKTATDSSSQWKRQLCKEAPARIRMLNQKLHTVSAARPGTRGRTTARPDCGVDRAARGSAGHDEAGTA